MPVRPMSPNRTAGRMLGGLAEIIERQRHTPYRAMRAAARNGRLGSVQIEPARLSGARVADLPAAARNQIALAQLDRQNMVVVKNAFSVPLP